MLRKWIKSWFSSREAIFFTHFSGSIYSSGPFLRSPLDLQIFRSRACLIELFHKFILIDQKCYFVRFSLWQYGCFSENWNNDFSFWIYNWEMAWVQTFQREFRGENFIEMLTKLCWQKCRLRLSSWQCTLFCVNPVLTKID